MALYKYVHYLHPSRHPEFDRVYRPGDTCVNSGIYRCEGCADEIALNTGTLFPPADHHQHAPNQGPVRWKLIVFAQER